MPSMLRSLPPYRAARRAPGDIQITRREQAAGAPLGAAATDQLARTERREHEHMPQGLMLGGRQRRARLVEVPQRAAAQLLEIGL